MWENVNDDNVAEVIYPTQNCTLFQNQTGTEYPMHTDPNSHIQTEALS